MTYRQALDYLLGQLPVFQRIGPAAYKADLNNTILLSRHFNHPERNIKHIHIAGTNGKGSVAHMLASVLQKQGYKTGLATSPHMLDYRERIKINGKKIPKKYVCDFVRSNIAFFKTLQASFFEISIALTFKYFSDESVDIAVIETGLGGRLDSTNIIHPELAVITNIGYDHTDLLGDTLEKIAAEKAGIIKEGVPVVIGRRQDEIHHVFERTAAGRNTVLSLAEERFSLTGERLARKWGRTFRHMEIRDSDGKVDTYLCDLLGMYQTGNLVTTLAALEVLNKGGVFSIPQETVKKGLMLVAASTGLTGRWQQIRDNPRVICDTGHNADGIRAVVMQIRMQKYKNLHVVIGMVREKDAEKILSLLPCDARYYFCAPDVPRALPAVDLASIAASCGLNGRIYESVREALSNAVGSASEQDLVFVGGSTFVVAEVI